MNLGEILGERLAIVGGTGSGKSYTARGLVEKVLALKHGRVGIIDPTGVWHGLRVNADGKSPGFPVVIFGGDRSDVPLIETAGRVVAQAVASTHQSWIIDTSALRTKAAERRFMLDFLDALFEANRADITLVVDEADRFSPQRMSPEVARLHERMEEIVRRGRVRGFTPWLITQRPASLNKDVLSQATAMICMRMTGAHDRSAMADVIEGQADKATAREIIGSMPNHKTGHGLVWAPQRGILQAVHFPQIVTLDTMRAPKPGERRSDNVLPPIDIGALREKLATVEIEAKANDPKALKAEIARLKAELAKAPATPVVDTAAIEAARANGFRDGSSAGLVHEVGVLQGVGGLLIDVETALGKVSEFVRAAIADAAKGQAELAKGKTPEPRSPGITHRPTPFTPSPASNAAQRSPSAPPPGAAVRRNSNTGSGGAVAGGLGKGDRLTLTVLAQHHPTRVSASKAAAIAGYSVRSSTWRNILSRLRQAALIEQGPEPFAITNDGLMVLGPFDPLPTGAALLEHWMARVGKGDRETLRILATLRGECPSSDLAQRAGYSSSSSTWRNILSRLRTLGLIEGSRNIKLHEDLR